MHTLMLILHVTAAILLIGPVTVAVSTFHSFAKKAAVGDDHAKGIARLLQSISQKYGMFSVLVPLLGFGVWFTDWNTYKSDYFMHTAILLSIIAWAILFFLIIPTQKKAIHSLGLADAGDEPVDLAGFHLEKAVKMLPMFGGIFSALWVVCAVLMFF